jgi:hypothetical protein
MGGVEGIAVMVDDVAMPEVLGNCGGCTEGCGV